MGHSWHLLAKTSIWGFKHHANYTRNTDRACQIKNAKRRALGYALGNRGSWTPLMQFTDFALRIWSGKPRLVNTSRAIHWLCIADVILEDMICEHVSCHSLILHCRYCFGNQDFSTPLVQITCRALQKWSWKPRFVDTSRAIH